MEQFIPEMIYTLFGYGNPSGAFFYELIAGESIEIWGRRKPQEIPTGFVYCDLNSNLNNPEIDLKGLLVSFSPIWLLSKFLTRVWLEHPERLKNLCGIIAISSSSYITKQFAFSNYDKGLASRLNDAHLSLISLCNLLGISCQILAPSLVYGTILGFRDQNVSKIVRIMRLMPVIMLPESTGTRQPIHASQLANVVHKFAGDMINDKLDPSYPQVLPLGGDEVLSYTQFIARIRDSLPLEDIGRKCRIVAIPNRVFLSACSPLLPINTKLFEALMRINSDLSGFKTASSLLAEEAKAFPILPFPY